MTEAGAPAPELKFLVREAIEEFIQAQQSRTEPAYKTELQEERKRREHLERRVNELIEDSRKSRKAAEEAERSSAIRSELQRLGVTKVDLAFKAVKDEIVRTEDGRLLGNSEGAELSLKDYLTKFVSENPELLPGRIAGGSGAGGGQPEAVTASQVDIDKIKPGMSAEDLERVRQEIARVARNAVRGM
ncbi:MAG TPA: hypothetical protein VES20_23625 [Bryobacteraceae bacterium]|nr:hypothetical protein [Bryobacteraceae bacterium]